MVVASQHSPDPRIFTPFFGYIDKYQTYGGFPKIGVPPIIQNQKKLKKSIETHGYGLPLF